MNGWKKSLSSLLVVVMLLAILPVTALAASPVTAQITGDGAISITTSTYGQLKAAVDASAIPYGSVKSITMTAGVLNSTDITFINSQLTSLETLNVIGSADFLDSTLPSKAFEGNQTLQNVKLLNTKTISSRVFYQALALGGRLKTVELPSATSIADRAFYRTPMSSLILGENPPKMIGSKGGDEGYWFKEANPSLKIYVPTPEAIAKYEDVFAFEGFSIKVIGDDSEDDPSGSVDDSYTDYGNAKVIPRKNAYYTGDYKLSLNFYSFNSNLNAWKSNANNVPQLDPMTAIQWAKNAGFDAVDVTEYYIPGYSNDVLPAESEKPAILQYARDIKAKAKEVGIAISGTGAQNNFVQPSEEKRALDLARYKFWIDVAAEMGAPVIRVFAGPAPSDTKKLGWEAIAKDRLVPPLKELAVYAATKGVKLGLQNHGDFISTADQTIQIIKWVDHPNIGVIDDTGYFRPFRGSALNYNWYADINAVLPYSNNFQVKKKPAGAETSTLMDMDRLFRGIRSSDYRGYIPAELLWNPGDPGHPSTLTTPPYDEISAFLAKMKSAMSNTKDPGKTGVSSLSARAFFQGAELTWSPVAEATGGYFIKRKNADNTYSLVRTVSSSTYSFTHTGLTSYQNVTYVVTGFNSEIEFPESNEVTVMPYASSHSHSSSNSPGGSAGGGASGGSVPTADGSSNASGGGSSSMNGNTEGVKLNTTTVNEKYGNQTAGKVIVTAENLNQALEQLKAGGAGQNKLIVQVDGTEPVAMVQLPADAWIKAQQSVAANTVLSIRSNISGYDLPLKAINAAGIPQLLKADAKDAIITILIEKVSSQTASDIAGKASQSGLNILGTSIQYQITAQSKEKTVEINDLNGSYISRMVSLPGSLNGLTASVVLYQPDTGKFSFVPAVFENFGGKTLVTFKRPGNGIYSIVTANKAFADLKYHWAKNDIELLASKLVVDGTSNDQFSPDNSITRAEFAALLVRSLGLDPVKEGSFTDVAVSDWYSAAVHTAAKAGLVNGFENGAFKPNDTITREQMALMIARAIQFTGTAVTGDGNATLKFQDSGTISSWAQSAVAAATNAQIINGVSDTSFAPSAKATRAEAAVVLKRLLQYVHFMN